MSKSKKGLPENVKQQINKVYQRFYIKYDLDQILQHINMKNNTKKGLPENVKQQINKVYQSSYIKYDVGKILQSINIINDEIEKLKNEDEKLELAEKKVELAAHLIRIINSGSYPKNFRFRSILMIFPELLTMEFNDDDPITRIEPDSYDKAMLIIMGKSVMEDELMVLKLNLFGEDEVNEERLRNVFGITKNKKEIHIDDLSEKLGIEKEKCRKLFGITDDKIGINLLIDILNNVDTSQADISAVLSLNPEEEFILESKGQFIVDSRCDEIVQLYKDTLGDPNVFGDSNLFVMTRVEMKGFKFKTRPSEIVEHPELIGAATGSKIVLRQ